MNYFYLDFQALRFKLKGGMINCFWRDLFGIRIKKGGTRQLHINYWRFILFWEHFFDGIKGLITGEVR